MVVSLTNIIRLIKVRGRSRLVLTLAERMGANGQILVCDAQHNVYILPANVSQSWSLAATGRYDTAECRLIEWFAQPDSTVLDIGASLGLYSVPLASCAQKGSFHVQAVEPIPENMNYLKRSIELNGLSDYITFVSNALGPERGLIPMDVEPGLAGNAALRTGKHEHHKGFVPYGNVNVQPLDDLHFTHPLSIIKIDVEGYELDVLLGGEEVIRSTRPVIIGEFDINQLQRRNRTAADLSNWCTTHNYTVFGLRPSRRRWWSDRLTLVSKQWTPENAQTFSGLLLLPADRTQELDQAFKYANS